jgi:hypothetical protein
LLSQAVLRDKIGNVLATLAQQLPGPRQSGPMQATMLSWHEPPRYWYCAVICGRFTYNSHGRR